MPGESETWHKLPLWLNNYNVLKVKKKRRTSFFDCSGCFIIINFPVKTGRCSDESGSVPPAWFPSVSSSNFLNLLNYWCPAVSIIFCSAIYPLNVPPCSPSACLSVIGRGEWPVLPVLPPHLPPISSSASPGAAVCISCVFVLFPRESHCFLYIFFPPLCPSGSLCLCHLRLLAPPPARTSTC